MFAAIRDHAARLAHCFADGYVIVVTVKHSRQAKAFPHLAKSGVDIQEYVPAGTFDDFPVFKKTHDVQQHYCVACALQGLCARHTDGFFPIIANQAIVVFHTKAVHGFNEHLKVHRISPGAGLPGRIAVHVVAQAIDKQDLPAQFPESKQVLHQDPAVTTLQWFLRQ